MKEISTQMRALTPPDPSDDDIIDRFNPFKAGQSLRKSIDTALISMKLPDETKSVYYIDDRFSGLRGQARTDTDAFDEAYIPEVLVVGATSEVGRFIVKYLLLNQAFRVRVLVSDLYTRTLDMFGIGVTYCQGDLENIESLEFAVTDVDKIVLCSPPAEAAEMGRGLPPRVEHAKKTDVDGLGNLLHAFQNVRFADYGSSQAVKRTLFKFRGRVQDFEVFSLGIRHDASLGRSKAVQRSNFFSYQSWKRNHYGNGAFSGRVQKFSNGEEALAVLQSRRLRSRENPEFGIDLGMGFGGLILRVCSDGGTYEAFVRTGEFYENGTEYVCNFTTAARLPQVKRRQGYKFMSVRLPFQNFQASGNAGAATKPFEGKDVRILGFRFRSSMNRESKCIGCEAWCSFYIAFSDIKLYRSQPDPEFLYVKHDIRLSQYEDAVEKNPGHQSSSGTSSSEAYYKYRGEMMLRNSGLNYAIVRSTGHDVPVQTDSGSSIVLSSSNEKVLETSPSEVAQVCVDALMNPHALNKSFYVTRCIGLDGTSGKSNIFQSLSRDEVE